MDLIPKPKELSLHPGSFTLTPGTHVVACLADPRLIHAARVLRDHIMRASGLALPITVSPRPLPHCIYLRQSGTDDGEAHSISIDPDLIVLDGGGPRSLFRAVQTLAQVIFSSGVAVPCLEITDAPDFRHRGFYHDITRGKVPTLETLKELVDRIAFYKLNELQLYIEHSFAFRSIPELWADRDPITPGEILELDEYCAMSHVELIPSMSTFGHLYELLRLPRFEHLNELDIEASKLPFDLRDRMMHYTIDPSNPESFTLIRQMIEEFLPLFSSRYFNICCDETFDLGRGRNRGRAQQVGVGRIYIDFVKKIMDVVIEKGKTPMFWGDIVLRSPELIPEIPKNAVFLNWDYGASPAESKIRTFAESGVCQYVCPGVNAWSRFAADIESASANIATMIRYGRAHGAAGVLNTDWGDYCHVNLFGHLKHGMALGAALSWNTDSFSETESFDRAVSRLEWNDSSGLLAGQLRELGSLCRYDFGNLYAWVFDKASVGNRESWLEQEPPDALFRNYDRAAELERQIGNSRAPACPTGVRSDLDEFAWSAAAVRWMLALLLFKKKYQFGQQCTAPLDANGLSHGGHELLQRFRRLWRRRNKESELRNVVGVFVGAMEKVVQLSISHGAGTAA